MKRKLKKILAVAGIVAMITPNIYAATEMKYNIEDIVTKYEILLDGESVEIPDTVKFSDGHSVDLNPFKDELEKKTSNVIKYVNGTFTYNGGLSQTSISSEYLPFFNNIGILKVNINEDDVIKRYEKYGLLGTRIKQIENYQQSIAGTTDGEVLKLYNLRLSNYIEDVERMQKIQIDNDTMTIMSSLPYLSRTCDINEEANVTSGILKETRIMKYYVYDLIYRDLRLNYIRYSTDSNTFKSVPEFDMNKYTYTIKLPENIADNATITTESMGFMDAILKYNNIVGYNLAIEVEDDVVKLVNGYGVAKINVVFNMLDTFGEYVDGYTSNPSRQYTVVFTKNDFLKGDLDRNNIVNANDAAIALDLYKYGNVTDEELKIGDMDNNGIINANDAALILDIYKYGN